MSLCISHDMNTLQLYAAAYTQPMDLLAVRKHLKAVRKAKHLTQDDIADDAVISQSVISRLEDLEKNMSEVEFETIRKIVEEGLSMPLSAFFLQIETGAKPAVELPTRDAPTVLETLPQAADPHAFRQMGTLLLAAARHAEALAKAAQRARPARSRKSPGRRRGR